jgi:AAA family ATP:ADP antiporter
MHSFTPVHLLLLLQITTVDEASQFYPLFGLGANVALIFSGRAVKIFSQIRAELPPDVDGWGLSLRGLMGMVVIGGFLIAGIFYWLNRTVVPRVQKRESKKKKKAKMSVGESFAFLAGSRCGAGFGTELGGFTAGACQLVLCRA